jgi:hypothetical protein
MSSSALRQTLTAHPPYAAPPALLAITGASGAGKTAAVAALHRCIEPRVLPVLGVPSPEEMRVGWESPRAWQKAMTWFWVRAAKTVHRTRPLVVLEGSFDPQYAVAACAANGIARLQLAVLDADVAVLEKRLAARGQRELVTADLAPWATYLRDSTKTLGGAIVDASRDLSEVVEALCALALPLVKDSTATVGRDT